MTADDVTSVDPLFARADKAISDAIVTRAQVRTALIAARGRRVRRADLDDVPPPPGPLEPLSADFLEPWWSVARALASATEIMREADAELDRGWRHVLRSIQTPLTLVRG